MDESTALLAQALQAINKLNQAEPFYNFRLTRGMCVEKFGHSIYKEQINRLKSIGSYEYDYVRLKTIELLVLEITEKRVPGAMAEAGVYTGEISAFLNHLMPERKLYLFDTFSGFTPEQLSETSAVNYSEDTFFDYAEKFSGTSVELVMSKMETPENCIICKGLFQETSSYIDEPFCFVSIDMDLYQSTMDTISYFYPRLQAGGYLYIHDYNDDELHGVKKAVQDYSTSTGQSIHLVPLPDHSGTVVVAK